MWGRGCSVAGAALANLKRVLWHLLGGTRGGPQRIRIVALLRDRPYNTNQLAELLGADYKTVQHHLRVLRENRIASPTGDGYGAVYLLTKDMEESLSDFDVIAATEHCLRVEPAEAVAWLQRWTYDLLSSRLAGTIRYHVGETGTLARLAAVPEPADLAGFLRRLAGARGMSEHPLNARLFFEDLLFRYRDLVAAR